MEATRPASKDMQSYFLELVISSGAAKTKCTCPSSTCDGRRFFITDTGHIGLAPHAAPTGDLTFEVQGCRVPYVMRPCPDAGAETFTIVSGQTETSARSTRIVTMVGECWIHGMMGDRFSDGLKIRECSSYSEDLVIY